MNNVFISSEQDVIISYCRNTDKGSMPASINVSDVRTGKLLVKVSALAPARVARRDSWEEAEEGTRRGSDEEQHSYHFDDGFAAQQSLLVTNLSAAAEEIISNERQTHGDNVRVGR